jgi:3-hydroxyisobutyrate dehydrogenase
VFMAQIAFLGTGTMGGGMARNLLKAGHTVRVYNRTRAKADALTASGAQVADSPHDAAQNADVIISMVADDDASRAVWLAARGALAAARPGMLCVECSTLTPGWIHQLAEHAAAQGCELLDAPVTGSKPQAENAELNFLVGGPETGVQRARPFLLAMGKNIFYFGANGSGAMVKLINNLIAAVELVAFGEGLALAEQSGLDVHAVADFVLQGPPGSNILKRKAPALLAHDYTPHFALRWMHKDLSYGLAEGAQRNVPMPTISATRELIRMAMAQGWSDKDYTAFYELLCPRA